MSEPQMRFQNNSRDARLVRVPGTRQIISRGVGKPPLRRRLHLHLPRLMAHQLAAELHGAQAHTPKTADGAEAQ